RPPKRCRISTTTSPVWKVLTATVDAAATAAGVTLSGRATPTARPPPAPSCVAPGGPERESVATTNPGTPSASTDVATPPAASAARERPCDLPDCAEATPIDGLT